MNKLCVVTLIVITTVAFVVIAFSGIIAQMYTTVRYPASSDISLEMGGKIPATKTTAPVTMPEQPTQNVRAEYPVQMYVPERAHDSKILGSRP